MEKLEQLNAQLKDTTDFMEKLEIKDQILELEYQLGIKEKPKLKHYECIGCSA